MSIANRHPAMPDYGITEADCEETPDAHEFGVWWCLRCESRQRHGDPFDGCPDCGFLLGEETR